ncbi:MAG: hypothetical protein ACREQI_00920 [Candidatus Binataceae bacterium]
MAATLQDSRLDLGHAPSVGVQLVGDPVVLDRVQTALSDGSIFLQFISQIKAVEPASHKFKRLLSEWRKGTGPSSSLYKIISHPSYLSIIGMKDEALPFIFEELQRKPDYWFAALRAITDENPVGHDDSFDRAVQAWLNWGEQHGYVRRGSSGDSRANQGLVS